MPSPMTWKFVHLLQCFQLWRNQIAVVEIIRCCFWSTRSKIFEIRVSILSSGIWPKWEKRPRLLECCLKSCWESRFKPGNMTQSKTLKSLWSCTWRTAGSLISGWGLNWRKKRKLKFKQLGSERRVRPSPAKRCRWKNLTRRKWKENVEFEIFVKFDLSSLFFGVFEKFREFQIRVAVNILRNYQQPLKSLKFQSFMWSNR